MNRWNSPVGPFDVTSGPHGVARVAAPTASHIEALDSALAERLDDHVLGKPAQLALDFQGLHPVAQVALAKVLEIPHGEMRPATWVAREIGRPGSVRPVVAALETNPLPLLVPGHRVSIGNGNSADFGVEKAVSAEEILVFEGVDLVALAELASSGVEFLGQGGVFHLPTCHKLVAAESVSELHSADEAHKLHLEVCRSCRPL